ncbi:MAG: His/Gly/Thr/Pro-type tRNA ligase C-terminal domain-containing protein, partial [Burkholderiales bacterium]
DLGARATFVDLRQARAGDRCPRCEGGTFAGHRGIEVGQVFYLGTKYSTAMGATFLDASGQQRPIEMGCYGIGITRTVAAAVEQHHDADGIRWPVPIAPYEVLVTPLQMNDPAVVGAAERLHVDLEAAGIEVLLDDRDERPGVKFKDADLIGVPFRINVGRKLPQGLVEIVTRRGRQSSEAPLAEAPARVAALRQEALE